MTHRNHDRWAVRDTHGNIWPPGFRSRLTNPEDPLCLPSIKHAREGVQAAISASERRETAAAAGTGWGSGYIGKLSARSSGVQVRQQGKLALVDRAPRGKAKRKGNKA